MSLVLSKLLELADREPSRVEKEVSRMTESERVTLLEAAAVGTVSRRLAHAHCGLGRFDESTLLRKAGITTFHARTSLPALPAFEVQMFRADRDTWGRAIVTPANFLGPGYFGVSTDNEELILDFDRVPPAAAVPAGWPPVVANTSGIAAIAFSNVTLRFRGSGAGILVGSVWRNGRDQGAFVDLIRVK